MWWKNIFSSTSEEEKAAIQNGRTKLIEMASDVSSKHYKDEWQKKKDRDGICPKCKNEEVVDKISRVQGSGSVHGSLFLGTGSIYGESEIDTNEVNHCNKCGNQWKKYKTEWMSTDDVIADWMNELAIVLKGENKYAERTVVLLKDVPAESIWEEGKRVADECWYSTRESLTLSFLRTKFKSVYKK